MSAEKTPGQQAYEANIAAHPLYHDGSYRRTWSQLGHVIRAHWERIAARAENRFSSVKNDPAEATHG